MGEKKWSLLKRNLVFSNIFIYKFMALKTVSLDLYQNGEKKVRVPL